MSGEGYFTTEDLKAVGDFLPLVPQLAVVDEVLKQEVNRDRVRILVARSLGYVELVEYLEAHLEEQES